MADFDKENVRFAFKDKTMVNDILINDRVFLSHKMTNYLKTEHKVDIYIPARENMDIF